MPIIAITREMGSLGKGVARGLGEELGLPVIAPLADIYAIASKGGAIIRGWGATHLLREIPHVVSVCVCAPWTFAASA